MSVLDILNNRKNLFFDEFLTQFAEGSPEYKLIEIFSYGTWKDYKAIEGTLPANIKLTPGSEAANKLKQLSIASYFVEKKTATFKELMSFIEVDSVSDMEDVVCGAIVRGLIHGQINELNQVVEVTRAASRCIRNNRGDILAVKALVGEMRTRISDTLKEYA